MNKTLYPNNFEYVFTFGHAKGEDKILTFAGSHPAEAFWFLGRKNPQRAFLRRGRKAVGPMS
jgi:hypothetical protein